MCEYNVSTKADNEKFKLICRRIENLVDNAIPEPLLEDVDGTQIQIYKIGSGKIKVYNDYEVDAVYIDSDAQLDFI